MELKTGKVQVPNIAFKDLISVPDAQERLVSKKDEFCQLATKGEVTRETILKGWNLYEEIDFLRERVAGRFPSPTLPVIRVMSILEGGYNGSPIFGLRQFEMDTYKNGYFGEFFEGKDLHLFK